MEGAGIGDQIIFLSLVPEVKEMCSRLSVYVDHVWDRYVGGHARDTFYTK